MLRMLAALASSPASVLSRVSVYRSVCVKLARRAPTAARSALRRQEAAGVAAARREQDARFGGKPADLARIEDRKEKRRNYGRSARVKID